MHSLCRAPLQHRDHPWVGRAVGDRLGAGGAHVCSCTGRQRWPARLPASCSPMWPGWAWLPPLYLLVLVALRKDSGAFKSSVFWLVFLMLALTVAGYFGIQPILAQLKAGFLF